MDEIERARRAEQQANRPPPKYEMERDVRLDDAEEAAAREAARVAGIDALFATKASVSAGRQEPTDVSDAAVGP